MRACGTFAPLGGQWVLGDRCFNGRIAREAPETYRRRRLVFVLAAVGVLVFLLVVGFGGGSEPADEAKTPEEARQAALDADPVELTVSVSGDLLIHSPVFFEAQALAGGTGYEFGPMLAELRPYVEDADLGICHVETPITDAPPAGLPLFNAPPELADAVVETGWDICDTASNHSLDLEQEGVDATGKVLDRAGLGHTGSFESAEAREEPLIVDVNGVRVALVAYTTDTNGLAVPNPYSVNVAAEPDQVIADARAARAAGADVVIVNMHWSSEIVGEYLPEPSAEQREFAEALAAAPEITAVAGQGPHVVQPIEWINDKPVIFSEGNLIANQGAAAGLAPASEDGIVALLEIVVDGDGARVESVSYVPVFVSKPDFTVLPVGDGLESGAADEASLRASYERTVDVVGQGPQTKPIPPRLP